MGAITLLILFLLSGCVLKDLKQQVVASPIEQDHMSQAIEALHMGYTLLAVDEFKKVLEEPGPIGPDQCRAAFYLYAFDDFKKDYLPIVLADECTNELMAEQKVVKQLLELERDHTPEECRKSLKNCHERQKELLTRIIQLEKDYEELQTENSRLHFEINKLEEIRRETEKWRLK